MLWPAVSSNVVGVGGTSLTFSGGSLVSETAWSGSGGGLSVYETEPSYQINFGVPRTNGKRAVPDVSYNADYQNSPVSVYDTYGYGGWLAVGGTSAGAPQWAAIQSVGLSTSNNNFYQNAKSVNYPSYFRDILSGTNGLCGYYCTATTGYDYVTGLGSPLTVNYNAAATADFSISASPSTLTIQNGALGTANIIVTSLNGFSDTVSLTLSNPSDLTTNLSHSSLVIHSGGLNTSALSISVSSTAAAGIYTVTVTGANSSFTHNANITVIVPTVPTLVSISVTPANRTISIGSKLSYRATGKYSDGTTVDITNLATWASSNPGVATISATTGLARALSSGTTIINATYGGMSGSTMLTVRRH